MGKITILVGFSGVVVYFGCFGLQVATILIGLSDLG